MSGPVFALLQQKMLKLSHSSQLTGLRTTKLYKFNLDRHININFVLQGENVAHVHILCFKITKQ